MRQLTASPMLLLIILHGCGNNEQILQDSLTPPLISAAAVGDTHSLDLLLHTKHVIDERDACQWTPLMKAALNGHIDIIRRLLQAGASVDLSEKGGYTAMMLAASNNHSEIVELLLKHGADVNHVEQTNGWNALIWAAKQGHVESVQSLLAHSADLNQRDFQGKLAIDWAIEGAHEEIIGELTASD